MTPAVTDGAGLGGTVSQVPCAQGGLSQLPSEQRLPLDEEAEAAQPASSRAGTLGPSLCSCLAVTYVKLHHRVTSVTTTCCC